MPPAPDTVPTRRMLLRGSAVAGALGGAAALGLGDPAPAEAKPGHHHGRPLLSTQARHLVGRFSYSVTPAVAADVRARGSAQKWFERQLQPSSVSDGAADRLMGWFPSLRRSPQDLWSRQVNGVEGGWEVMFDYERWVLMRRMRSRRQLLEVMAEFWENHLHVPAVGDSHFVHRVSYGTMIRSHALGRFDDLLVAAITHPSMLIFLDGAVSTATHPNENLGRELLELHTLGRGNYSEADVEDSARILTGWSVDMWHTWAASYESEDHARGRVTVKGFTDPNPDADGRALTRRYLTYLAHHPDTAQKIARKLAVKFVRDDPPQGLVDRLAKVYLDNDTEIRPVLHALVASEGFRSSVGAKVRDPGEDIVASYLALDVRISAPPASGAKADSAVSSILWQVGSIGTMPFAWARPDGQPIDNASWSSPSRLIASMRTHYTMSGGWYPRSGTTYHQPKHWLPQPSIRFDRLVDHLSQEMLHRHATNALVKACSQATDVGRHEVVTADHPLVKWRFPRLLTTLLDSPPI